MKSLHQHCRPFPDPPQPGTAERQLESIIQPALRQLIPVRNFPRCMIQFTLQVMEMPESAYVNTKLLQAQLVGRKHSSSFCFCPVSAHDGGRTCPSSRLCCTLQFWAS